MKRFSLKSPGNRRPALILGILAFSLVSGCSGQNFSANLSIAVTPNNGVLLGPGPDASCLDRLNQKKAQQAGGITTLTRSVTGPVIGFNDFFLEWTSTDTLYVEGIRVTVEGPGITGGKYQYELASDEIEALLATTGAVINDTSNGTTKPAADVVIDSLDPARADPKGAWVQCGMPIGGITLTDGTNTRSFSAHVTVEVIGTAVDSQGNERFVRSLAIAQAQYYGS